MHMYDNNYKSNLIAPTEEVVSYLKKASEAVNKALDRFLPPANKDPQTLHKAMRYSLFAGGKRIRPALCLAAAECCGGSWENAMPLACAIECIHTYSLIHDDLPAMDNDDFRRGRPTCHKVFGEAIAILAGDALLTIAFEILSKAPDSNRYSTRDYLIALTHAAGSLNLVGGQVGDLEAEGKQIPPSQLRKIHLRKTSALLSCSLTLGAMSAGATDHELRLLGEFGKKVGLAFQVIDDILDVTQPSEVLGKTAGKDIKDQKATYPSIIGLEKSRKLARQLTNSAMRVLEPLANRARILRGIAQYLLVREY